MSNEQTPTLVMGLAITAEVTVTRDGEIVPPDEDATSNDVENEK